MPFDPFGSRRGFRYLPDPLGRLGFGRYMPERDLPDPFGRLPAPTEPDPEIMNFRNPLGIRDSVGMAGRNRRRDVAKIEGLLGRAGALDLAETDGATGFFGARTDEAVRKFQKDRRLKVDGLINPNGPTLKALVARLRGTGSEAAADTSSMPFVEQEKNPAPPFSERPPVDPRHETARRIVERLLYQQRLGDDPLAIPLAKFLDPTLSDSQAGAEREPTKQKYPQVAAAPIALAPLAVPALSALGRAVLGGLGAGAVGALSGDTPKDETEGKPTNAERRTPVTPQDPKLPNIPPEGRKPTKTETPASPPDVPELPGFSMPEDRPDLVEVFPDQRDELPQSLIVEHRGGPRVRKLTADIADLGRAINAELKGDAEHIGGAIGDEGQELKETHLYGPDGERRLVGGSFLDIALKSKSTKRRLLINTIDAKAGGDPSKRESAAAGRIIVNKETGDILALIPKPRKGETLDMEAVGKFLRPLFEEILRPRDETKPWDIPQLFNR